MCRQFIDDNYYARPAFQVCTGVGDIIQKHAGNTHYTFRLMTEELKE
jgi:hypothetical protein